MEPLSEASKSSSTVQSKTGEPQLNSEFYLSFDNVPFSIDSDFKETLAVLVDETQFQPFAITDQESFRTGGAQLQYPTGVDYPDIEITFTERRDVPIMRTFYEAWQRRIWDKPSGGRANVGGGQAGVFGDDPTQQGVQPGEAGQGFTNSQANQGTFNPPAQWMGGFSLFPLNRKSGAGQPPEYAVQYRFIDVYPTESDPITFNQENVDEMTEISLSFHVHHVINNFQ